MQLLPTEHGLRQAELLAELEQLVPEMQQNAAALDRNGEFPTRELQALRRLGALSAPLPAALGGLGMGTEPSGALGLMEALRLLGRGNLSVGRLFEAHVNAFRLITLFGTEAQAWRLAEDALNGHLFGLWVTDSRNDPLTLDQNYQLHGAKFPCSGAGHIARALVTTRLESGETRMLTIELAPGERASAAAWDVHGMRATQSGQMTFEGMHVSPDALVGDPGDYLREPHFSAGAWRTSAVTLGGLEALVGELRRGLVSHGRAADPHQQARVGEALIAQETARLWVRRSAQIGEAADGGGEDIANTVNLARLAVERACLDAIRIVQRALGMGAFRTGELTELLFRDLAIYLRQPAPDETLTVAARHFMDRDLPPLS